jgi:hypothetical protein
MIAHKPNGSDRRLADTKQDSQTVSNASGQPQQLKRNTERGNLGAVMGLCRKICCCDFSEDENLRNSNTQVALVVPGSPGSPASGSIEMKPMPYAGATGNYAREARTNSLIDPLVSPVTGAITSGGEPMSPLGASSLDPNSPRSLSRKRSISWAPKGFEPKTPAATPGTPPVRGIYKHQSSYGGGGGGATSVSAAGSSTPTAGGAAAGAAAGAAMSVTFASSTNSATGRSESPEALL